jgi:SAM-dependent methyltransferase
MNRPTTTRLRAPFRGVWQIVRFNWPKFVIAAVLEAIAIAIVGFGGLPFGLELVVIILALLLLVWLALSLVASHWIYDRSPLADWNWLAALFTELSFTPRRWANVHAGFDDTSQHLYRILPGTSGTVVDLFDPNLMTERSLLRARRATSNRVPTAPGKLDALPFSNASLDCLFLLFAAHEIRSRSLRLSLFREVYRSLAPAGKVVLVEHVRDFWNGLAFGPGVFHFFSRHDWLRTMQESGFTLRSESRITPFVHYFVLERRV